MKASLAATLTCLCCHAAGATCPPTTRAALPDESRSVGLVWAVGAPAKKATPAEAAPASPTLQTEPHTPHTPRSERALLLAGLALMAAIALRRQGGGRP